MRRVIYLLIALCFLEGCGDWWNMMLGEDNEIVIKGRQEIKNQKLVLAPGTRVIFKRTKKSSLLAIGGPVYEAGELIIGEGATLIAKGTPENPIVFKLDEDAKSGYLTFTEDCDKDSIVQYCKFEGVGVHIETSINITLCKFNDGGIGCYKSSQGIISYNTFINGGIGLSDTVKMKIIYNYISGSGIACADKSLTIINNNNIINSEDEAILMYKREDSINIYVTNNYIADCAGKTGVDITGEQSSTNVIYINPRTTPVPNAGCGW